MKFNLSIIIPTFKENNNIQHLINLIYKEINLKNKNFEILIVDDNSNDGIIKTINHLNKTTKNLRLLIRKEEPRDLSKSCTKGFLFSKFENILVMDADLQHNPKYLKKMISNFIKYKPDILVGCRKFNNRSKIKISFLRFILSKLIVCIFNKLLGFRTNDPMSGFFLFKKEIFNKNKKKLFNRGYKILADLIYNSRSDLNIIDCYINFDSRLKNKSKMNLNIIFLILVFLFRKKFLKNIL
jgi:dolichol-phosphate mannosyltransferase